MEGWRIFSFKEKIKCLKIKLKAWSKEGFGEAVSLIDRVVVEKGKIDEKSCEESYIILKKENNSQRNSGILLGIRKAIFCKNQGLGG